jgi:two-component system nitrate/nitrite response regulator NarL
MSEAIRVLIADDHPLFREGVAHSLSGEPDLTIVGQASTGEEASTLANDLLPDILLLDIAMPGQGGIATAQRISTACPAVKIIMLTVSENEDDLMRALKAGARGYILKGISAGELVKAVRAVAAGEVYIAPVLASEILFEMTHVSQPDPINELTDRERDILRLVGEGLTNREIGQRLHLAEKTIKHYMTNVLQKLQVRSRVEAALLAQERGLKVR